MASLLSKTRHRSSCYFCSHVSPGEAYHSGICIRHQLRISLRLFVRLARSGRFGKLWRVVTWER